MSDDQEQWRQRITPLAERAFALAVSRWQRTAPLERDELAEAQQGQAALRQIADELRARYPGGGHPFAALISEALLDYKYAIDAPPATSLRLHHYIESQSGSRAT